MEAVLGSAVDLSQRVNAYGDAGKSMVPRVVVVILGGLIEGICSIDFFIGLGVRLDIKFKKI